MSFPLERIFYFPVILRFSEASCAHRLCAPAVHFFLLLQCRLPQARVTYRRATPAADTMPKYGGPAPDPERARALRFVVVRDCQNRTL